MKRLFAYLVFLAVIPLPVRARTVDEIRAENLFLQGLEQYYRGDLKTAYGFFAKAEELDPENDAVHYYLGYVKAAEGNAGEAVEQFEKAYALDSTNVWYAMRLSRLYALAGRPAEADRLLVSLEGRRPFDTDIMSSHVEVYLAESEYDKADSLLNRIERLEGRTDYVGLTRMEISRQKGDYVSLFNRLDEYFSRSDVPAEIKKDMLDRLMRGGDPRFNMVHVKDYERLLETCLSLHPEDTAVIHLAGNFYYATGKSDRLSDLVARHTDDLYAVTLSAYDLFRNKDYLRSSETCERMISLAPDDRDNVEGATALRGDCFFSLGRYEDALKEYDRLLGMNPGNVMALNNYAYYLSVVGKNLGKAAKMSRKAVAAEPENPTYLDTYAWILHMRKKYREAQEVFKKAMVYGGSDSAEILRHYAATLEALGQTALAAGYRQKAAIRENEGGK